MQAWGWQRAAWPSGAPVSGLVYFWLQLPGLLAQTLEFLKSLLVPFLAADLQQRGRMPGFLLGAHPFILLLPFHEGEENKAQRGCLGNCGEVTKLDLNPDLCFP